MSLFKAVPAGVIETLFDEADQAMFKRADLGRYLGIQDIRHNFKNLVEKPRTREQLLGGVGTPSLSKGQNYTDCFVTLDGALEIVVKSKKPRAVELTKWLAKKGVEKVVEEQQQAIADRDTHIRAIEFENVGLQGEIRAKDQMIAMLHTRHVPNAQDPGKDNMVIIIRKNTEPENDEFFEYPYYIARIQRRHEGTKRRFFDARFPNHEIILNRVENANSVHAFNRFEENTHVERYQCHFRLVDIPEDVLRVLAA